MTELSCYGCGISKTKARDKAIALGVKDAMVSVDGRIYCFECLPLAQRAKEERE